MPYNEQYSKMYITLKNVGRQRVRGKVLHFYSRISDYKAVTLPVLLYLCRAAAAGALHNPPAAHMVSNDAR